MIDRTMKDEAAFRPERRTSALQMPLQAPPVNRATYVSAGAAGDPAGVQANGIFGTLGRVLSMIPV
ncbi:hypothetical protein [Streptomyces sp. NPDC001286]